MNEEGDAVQIALKDFPLYRPKNMEIIKKNEWENKNTQENQSSIRTNSLLDELTEKLMEGLESTHDQIRKHNLIHQSFLAIGWSIFNRSLQVPSLEVSKVVKPQCLHFFQRLRKFFSSVKIQELQILLRKLDKIQIELDQQEEDSNFKLVRQPETVEQQSANVEGMQNLTQKLKEMEQKVEYRDSVLQEMTSGYLKDVQHLKEQLFRNKFQEQDIYEVQYFDENEGFTVEQTVLLNQKISLMKYQYESETKKLRSINAQLQNENTGWKIQANNYKDQLKSLDSSIGLLGRVFQLDNDPYQTWKNIQDLKGNAYFFQVFEQQKHTYGINYREIDKLLLNSKSHFRELQLYKLSLDDQMSQFIDKQVVHMFELRKELDEKDRELMILENKEELKECQEYIAKHVEDLIYIKRNEMLQKLFNENGYLYELKDKFEYFQASQYLQRWILIAKMMKLVKNYRDQMQLQKEIKMILVDQKQIKQIKEQAQEQINIYKELYDELYQQYEKDKIAMAYWQFKSNYHIHQQKSHELEIQQLCKQKLIITQKYEQYKTNYEVLSSHYQILIKLLGFNLGQINTNDLTIKQVESQIKILDENKEIAVKIIVNQQLTQQKKLELFLKQTANRTKSTQTILMDVRTNLHNTQPNYAHIEKLLRQTIPILKDNSTNTEIRMKEEHSKVDVSINNTILDHLDMNTPLNIPQFRNVFQSQEGGSQIINREQQELHILPDFQSGEIQKLIDNERNDKFEHKLIKTPPKLFQITKEDINLINNGSALIYTDNATNILKAFTPPQLATYNVRQQLSSSQNRRTPGSTIFDKLYRDSVTKRERMDILKQHLETLDQFRWEQIMNIIRNDQKEMSPSLRRKVMTSNRPKRLNNNHQTFYLPRRREENTMEVIRNVSQSNETKKAQYYENLLIKHRNQTRRMQGTCKNNNLQKQNEN